MREKYDLNEILKEIEEDEKAMCSKNQQVSQDEIQKMLMEKRKKEKGKV